MFEYEQEAVSELMKDNPRFQSLFAEHTALKTQLRDAEVGVNALDDFALGKLKRQKLLAKDRMAHIIRRYQTAHV